MKYFDKYTAAYTKDPYQMLILDRHKNHELAEFQKYCKIYNIVIFGLLSYSFHLIQLFNIGCFNILKRAYDRQIKIFIKAYINHITKVEFFLAFAAVYKESIIAQNAQAGFRGAGLVPFDPQIMLSKLDVRLQTPTLFRPSIAISLFWVF